jgi:hypothetical protein
VLIGLRSIQRNKLLAMEDYLMAPFILDLDKMAVRRFVNLWPQTTESDDSITRQRVDNAWPG